ncbi:asparaginase [Peniophora sp. CONT]|nr:asparaginase [Peniophora sp. CONT]
MSRERSTPEQRALYHATLKEALRTGHAVLKEGGEALDATVAAVTVLENCPLFNAGKGAVFNTAGKNELEASIALSKPPASHPNIAPSRRDASVTLLTRARNPSQLARLLYLAQDDGVPHPMMSGSNAEEIGAKFGAKLVDPSYFFSENRWREHRRGLGLPEEPLPQPGDAQLPMLDLMPKGTVGAVALDVRGCIAACTSTGGRTNKLVGRVGDTPINGSGFWAEEWSVTGFVRRTVRKLCGKKTKAAVGVSGTGDGDYFIRQNTASTIARRMQYLNEPLKKSTQFAVDELRAANGDGGVIAIDDAGNVSMALNCPGMYRGVIYEDGVPKTAIFADEEVQ